MTAVARDPYDAPEGVTVNSVSSPDGDRYFAEPPRGQAHAWAWSAWAL
jgi:hypothetical protein